MENKNLLKELPKDCSQEIIETLISSETVRIERIISHGEVTPKGVWYDQSEDEFVVLIAGDAVIEYENGEKIVLKAADYLYLPRHKKHRVAYTSTDETTVWLALFFT